MGRRRAPAVVAATSAMVVGSVLSAVATVVSTPDPVVLADAMAAPGFTTTGAGFEELPPEGTPHGVGETPVAGFPTQGSTLSVLTNGDATVADVPDLFASAALGGGNVRGTSDFDVSVLRVDFVAPELLNCLQFDFKFLSQELPPGLAYPFNDAFIAELDQSTWTTSDSEISAPDNFAVDGNGDPMSVVDSGLMQFQFAQGTNYIHATPVMTARTLVMPGEHSLFLSIFDQADQGVDSAAFVDNLRLSHAATPEDCPDGAVVRESSIESAPATAVNEQGDTHTVTTTVTDVDTQDPVAGEQILFSVAGANTATGTGTTDAAGEAEFTYTGTETGDDAITACLDQNGNGSCDAPDEPVTSVLKTWEAAPPPEITLTPAEETNDVGDSHTVTANVTDAGEPAADAPVVFTVTGANTVTETVETDAAGDATFTYTGTGLGDDQITACFDEDGDGACGPGEVTATATKTWVLPDEELTLTPAAAENPEGTLHHVAATLTVDGGEVPVQNARIAFTVDGANPQTGVASTDAAGEGLFTYPGLAVGTDTITACVDLTGDDTCGPDEPTATVAKTWLPTTLDVTPQTATNTVGDTHTVTATLTTESGDPVPEARLLFIVTGANTAGGELERAIDGGLITDGDGQAEFSYTGGNTGTDTITVCQDINANRECDAGEATGTATKTWVSADEPVLTLTPNEADNPVETPHQVTATLTQGSDPIENTTILFDIVGTNPATGQATTNDDGQAEFTHTGTHPGTDTIGACADLNDNNTCDPDEPTTTATKTWLIPATGTAPNTTAAAAATLLLLLGTALLVLARTHRRTRTHRARHDPRHRLSHPGVHQTRDGSLVPGSGVPIVVAMSSRRRWLRRFG